MSPRKTQYIVTSGFTLIELLVVIAILGILAVGLLMAINPITMTEKARDSVRKNDIVSIRRALEQYAVDHNGQYPLAVNSVRSCAIDSNCYVYSTDTPNWLPELVDDGYLKRMPVDPINNHNAPWTVSPAYYSYSYGNVHSNGTFDLVARLENPNDPDRCELKHWKLFNGSSWCGTYSIYLFEHSPQNDN